MQEHKDLDVVGKHPSQPAPELSALAYFLGTWNIEGTIPPGSWGAGGPYSSTDTVDWLAGNFFLIGHSDYSLPASLGGGGKEIYVMGYDGAERAYTFDSFNSQGRHQVSRGQLSNDIWFWTSHADYDGHELQQRMTMKVHSSGAYSLKFEVSSDGEVWTTFMEGKATKK